MRRAVLRIGSLCTGYGGLDIAVRAVFGGRLVWCADNDKHAAAVLDVRYPGVPNLGDLTWLDWRTVESADIISAGFPCQDISYSGRGAGIEKGVRSGIWKNIVTGIRILRPKVIVVENVAALRSRGLDRVLGDLAEVGYYSVWASVRASDVGAPHRRERTFILGYGPGSGNLLAPAHTRGQRRTRRATTREAAGGWPPGGFERPGVGTVPGRAAAPDTARGLWDLAEPSQHSWHTDAGRGGDADEGRECNRAIDWGRYEPVIRRWEAITGRAAPQPTEAGTRGQTRLAAAFSEWLMGLPSGFVADLDLPYTAKHRLLGNGVVPQQAVAALRMLVGLAVEGGSGL
jgi:DNA (cytosine-5)-methyltransferase 1